jgi:hypothetical protein
VVVKKGCFLAYMTNGRRVAWLVIFNTALD